MTPPTAPTANASQPAMPSPLANGRPVSSSTSPRGNQWPGIMLALLGFGLLLGMTFYASSVRGILQNGHLMSDAWFQVTLLDAYLGFALFWVWVCSQEPRNLWRGFWFVAIMIFGNMATCLYVALWLYRRSSPSATATA